MCKPGAPDRRTGIAATATPGCARSRVRTLLANSSGVSCSGSYTFGLHRDLHRIVLATRMAFPVVGHQDPAEIGVAVEADAEEVPDLTLGPAHRQPHARQRRHHGVGAGHTHLDAQPLRRVAEACNAGRQQMHDDLVARLARKVVDGGHVERRARSASSGAVAQLATHIHDVLARDVNRRHAVAGGRRLDGARRDAQLQVSTIAR